MLFRHSVNTLIRPRVFGRWEQLRAASGKADKGKKEEEPAKESKDTKGRIVIKKCEGEEWPGDEGPGVDAVDAEWRLPRVVVVGAGMAGLSAAHHLVTHGITDVTVVEAHDKPGGRIRSCKLGGKTVVELGAGFLDGATMANSVVGLACREGLLQPPLFLLRQQRGLFFNSDGCVVPDRLASRATQAFNKVERSVRQLYRSGEGTCISLAEFLDTALEKVINTKFKMRDQEAASCVMNSLKMELKGTWGTDLCNISASQYGKHEVLPGGSTIVPTGMINVLKPLLKALPKCVKTKKPVQFIKWVLTQPNEDSPRAIVKCCDGEELPADYVIVTVSLGVLKCQAEDLFCPPLPEDKLEAIRTLGYGHVCKVLLQFERPFWVRSEGCVRPAWTNQQLDGKWYRSVCCLEEAPTPESNVLVVSLGGPEAVFVEKMDQCSLVKEVMTLVKRILGDTTIPMPKTLLRSNWSSDGFFEGAVSYMRVGSHGGHQMELERPEPAGPTPTLLLAGEAASGEHMATVHGARLSGVRQADRILQLTRLFKGRPSGRTIRIC